MLARAVVHRDLGDAVALVRGEDRDEAVQLAVQPHALDDLGAVGLQPAVHVVQPHTGDERVRPVEHAREQAPRQRVVAAGLPAGNEVEALVELREELGDLGRVVLEVGVDRHDDLAARLEESRLERRGLSEVPTEPNHDHVRVLVVQTGQHGAAPVGRAVVDEDDLERLPSRLECRSDLTVELLERGFLVEQRDDDGDHVKGGYRRVRSASSAPGRPLGAVPTSSRRRPQVARVPRSSGPARPALPVVRQGGAPASR